MQIISDNKKIKRRTRIAQISLLASLGVLAAGFVISLKPENTAYAYIALIIGFLLTQIALYYTNRWGKSPREDELVIKGFKGLGKQTTIYVYTTPVPHLLVGPMGVWIIIPYFQEGIITYDEKKNRWRQKSKNWYMRIFGRGGLGRPDQDALSQRNKLTNYFKKYLPEEKQPEINVALVFTSDEAKVDAPNAPIPTFALNKVKNSLRTFAKENPADPEIIAAVKDILPQESID